MKILVDSSSNRSQTTTTTTTKDLLTPPWEYAPVSTVDSPVTRMPQWNDSGETVNKSCEACHSVLAAAAMVKGDSSAAWKEHLADFDVDYAVVVAAVVVVVLAEGYDDLWTAWVVDHDGDD